MTVNELDARYGRTPERSRRARLIAIGATVVGVILVGAWAVWAGVFSPGAALEAQTVGSEPLGDDEILVRFQLSATPGATVSCVVEAQSEKHAIVGWKLVELPPSDEYTRFFEERLHTSEPAVVGLISDCRLA